jgi:hypothetical protein
MAKLNQMIAVNKTVKNDVNAAFTGAYHAIQRTAGLAGLSRKYQPRDDDGEQLSGEGTRVQIKVPEVIKTVQTSLARLFDLTATIDTTNTDAKAAVMVDGKPITPMLPVSTLLFLEKQLTDLHTFVRKLPLLDPAETWTASDSEDGLFQSEPVKTQRSKKVPRNHVKAAPTDKHPAQVEVYYEDVVVGDWTTIKFSGAIPHKDAKRMSDRINLLQAAVKQARELANMTEVTDVKIGHAILSYVFND